MYTSERIHFSRIYSYSFRTNPACDYKEVKKLFLKLLQKGEFRGHVVIFLDGLDQLSADDGAHLLDWIPATLSENVKLIVSTIPQEHGLLPR